MKSFAVLIFEVNCYESEPIVKIQWGQGLELGHKAKGIGQASVWLHVASDEKWKRAIPIELETSCLKICGPIDCRTAENFINEMKLYFDQLGVEYYEMTCSDD